MKKIGSLALGLALLGLASCATDEPLKQGSEPSTSGERDVFASITISLPTADGTRADTDNGQGIYTGDGKEIGQDYENQVGKILVVLAEPVKETVEGQEVITDYKLLTYATSDAQLVGTNAGANSDKVEYMLNFSSSELRPEVEDDELNGVDNIAGMKEVYVFAYCNPTERLENAIAILGRGNSIVNLEGVIEDNRDNTVIWQAGKFLMTNVEVSQVPGGIPSRAELVKNHNTSNTALDLGVVDVMRVVARFDFQRSKGSSDEEKDLELNQYAVVNIDGKTRIGVVELTHMAAFNIAQNYYYLPRTNTEWTWDGITTFCSGKDNNTNAFVMSPNKDDYKRADDLNKINLSDYFYAPISDRTSYSWTSLAVTKPQTGDWLGGKYGADNDEGWPATDTNYIIWRYVPENTIPGWKNGNDGYNYGSQRAGITTGVVFRAQFKPDDTALWNGHVIYVYKNVVYGDFDALKKYVDEAKDTEVAAAFNENRWNQISDPDVMEDLTGGTNKNGFTAYVPSTDGTYRMYYYYYNRHKSNGINTTLGVNEFGVVRNNVYKLKVTKINSLGLPTPPDPDDEDEKEQVFFTVDVRVLPWVVRVNNIEF